MTRRLLPLALALTVVATACGDAPPPPAAAPPPAPPPAKTAEQRVAFYQDCWRLYNEKNYDAFSKCYGETATSEAVDNTRGMVRGRTAIIDDRKGRDAVFSDRRGDLVLVLANGARIASVVVYSATNDGPMPSPDGKSMPATKKRFSEYAAHTVELDSTGSMAIADASYLDEGTMLAQLGVIKVPARKPVTPPATPPTVVVARNDATETGNIAAFRATVDAINKKDAKAFAAMLADDYKAIDVTMAKDQNRKEALAGIAEYQKAFSDMALNVANIWAAGDYVVASGTFTGTNTGPMPSMGLMKKTDKKINVRFIEIVKYVNGKAQEDWTFYNGAAFASQLGLK